MPASPAQIAANKKNASKLTGPRTEAGKARSRFNAVTHGAPRRVDHSSPARMRPTPGSGSSTSTRRWGRPARSPNPWLTGSP